MICIYKVSGIQYLLKQIIFYWKKKLTFNEFVCLKIVMLIFTNLLALLPVMYCHVKRSNKPNKAILEKIMRSKQPKYNKLNVVWWKEKKEKELRKTQTPAPKNSSIDSGFPDQCG